MHRCTSAAAFLLLLVTKTALATPQDTDIPGVTADISYLRQYNGVLHFAIVLHNGTSREANLHQPITFGDVVIVDAKANKKLFALKDADGHFLAGPVSDWNGGGRWYPKLLPNSDTIVWVLFDALASGDPVSVQGPVFHSFDNVPVGNSPPADGAVVTSSVPPLNASVLSANRTNGELKIRIKIANLGAKHITPGNGLTVRYADVYALDPHGKRSYPLLKDQAGQFIATPISDQNEGGRWFLSKVEPNGQVLVDLTFQAPPDEVKTVDIVFPRFGPFEAVPISGCGRIKRIAKSAERSECHCNATRRYSRSFG